MNVYNHQITNKSNINQQLKNGSSKNIQNDEKINILTKGNTYGNQENINRIKNGTIVARIDNIYLSIKDVPKYFSRLRILLFLLSVFNIMFLWIIFSMIDIRKNNFYCFDVFAREFKLCDTTGFCDNSTNGRSYIIFTNNPKIFNADILTELNNINALYLNYFLKDGLLFSLMNVKVDKFVETDKLYSIVFAVTHYENWNLQNLFYQYCNKKTIMIQIGISILLGVFIGNTIFGVLADVFGRKKILILIGIIQFLGTALVFFMTMCIIKNGMTEDGSNGSIDSNFKFNYTTDGQIMTVIQESKKDAFDTIGINDQYEHNFNTNNQALINTQTVRRNYSKYNLFFLAGLFLIFLCFPSLKNISLAYLLENSINDSEVYKNYFAIQYSVPVSYFLHFILITQFDNFHSPILFSGCCILIISFLICVIGYESPRHQYEFFEYKQITRFFRAIVPVEFLEKFYKSNEIPKFKKEMDKQKFNLNLAECLCEQVMFLGHKIREKRYKDMVIQNKFQEINRFELIKNPFILILLIQNNKHIKQNLLIIISLVAIIGFIFFLTISKFNITLVFSRKDLYNNFIVNQNVFYLCITMCISLYFFNFILKFFGYNIILFICFSMISVFSLLFEILCLGGRNTEDTNMYIFNSIEIVYDTYGNALRAMLYIVTFFATGLFCTLYFYLTKLTKTMYRCTFFGMIHIILDFTFLFSVAVSQYFEKNFFYVSVLSVIGFINAYFIREDFDFELVGDFKQIELEED